MTFWKVEVGGKDSALAVFTIDRSEAASFCNGSPISYFGVLFREPF